MSSSGSYAAAVVENGYIYMYAEAEDEGTEWSRIDSTGPQSWEAVAMSENGQHVYAAAYGGYLYGSHDFGKTWTRDVHGPESDAAGLQHLSAP